MFPSWNNSWNDDKWFRHFNSYHLLISLQGNFKDVALLGLGQEKEHGFGLVGGWADKYHATLRVVQVILGGEARTLD